MWVPKHKHPLFDGEKQERSQKRWKDSESGDDSEHCTHVLSLIEQGAGKDFLNYDFYKNKLPILEDDFDLKGFKFWNFKKDFGGGYDTFRGIDFSYCEAWHSEYKNAVFLSCSLDFARFYNCTFEKCAFAFTHSVAGRFEKCRFIDCDFAEPCTWENGTFMNSTFKGCFLGETTPFLECYFDELFPPLKDVPDFAASTTTRLI
jgi:uncharacterized protein YjbI with pentapeptide repeats